jgi:hypothetical protein
MIDLCRFDRTKAFAEPVKILVSGGFLASKKEKKNSKQNERDNGSKTGRERHLEAIDVDVELAEFDAVGYHDNKSNKTLHKRAARIRQIGNYIGGMDWVEGDAQQRHHPRAAAAENW